MRGRLAAVSCAFALGACASADGLLIEVTVEGGIADQVGAIDVWVGDASQDTNQFIRLPAAGDLQAVGEWPFTILIEPEAEPRLVWAGAFGYHDTGAAGGPPIAVGAISAPVEVVPGELRYATITLQRSFAPEADCLFVPGDGTSPPLVMFPPPDAPQLADCDDDGAYTDTDCNDLDPATRPGARELCDGIDNNCDNVCDEELDDDHDNYSRCTYAGCGPVVCVDGSDPWETAVGSCDCDDSDPRAFPGNSVDESPVCDGVDLDCNPATGDSSVGPEVAGNHLDDDCNGTCDVDLDGDVIATGAIPGEPLSPGTWATTCDVVLPDCDDTDPESYPNALERCDGFDNDCTEATVPGMGVCFLEAPEGCALAIRACSDLPGGLWDTCVSVANAPVIDEEHCQLWRSIENDSWPEQSWYDLTPDDFRDTCTIQAWRPDNGSGARTNFLCDPSQGGRTPLHTPFQLVTEPCTSRIAGGALRGGYELLLRDRATGEEAAIVDGCDVDLVVKSIDGTGQSDVRYPSIWFLIIQEKGTAGERQTEVHPVEIRVHYADASTQFACPATRLFDCD